jgi:hypothetical protein
MSDINTETDVNEDEVELDEVEIEEAVDAILPATLDNTITGYIAAKWANEALTMRGFKKITPQMVYQYMNNGLIATVRVGDQDRIRRSVATEWVHKFVANRARRIAEQAS